MIYWQMINISLFIILFTSGGFCLLRRSMLLLALIETLPHPAGDKNVKYRDVGALTLLILSCWWISLDFIVIVEMLILSC